MVNMFGEEITIAWGPDGKLRIAHRWGMPGGNCARRSNRTMCGVSP